MASTRQRFGSIPERCVIAIAGGTLIWWYARVAVAWWAALPCAALALALLTGRRWTAWLVWGTASLGLVLLAMPRLLSPRPEVVVTSLVLVALYIALTAATTALVTSPTFPHQTISLIIWLSVTSALMGRGAPWWTLAALGTVAAGGLLAARHDLPASARARRLLPLLACLLMVAVVVGALPVSQSPIQGTLTTFIQRALFPDEQPLPSAQQPAADQDTSASSIPFVRYTAPMLQLWMRLLEHTLVRWAVPLIAGLLILLFGTIVLLFLTRSRLSHVLRLLALPAGIFGAVVAVVLLTSTLQLPRGQALTQLYEQLDRIRSLSRAQQPTATAQALEEIVRSVPSRIQIIGIVLVTLAVLAIAVATVLILSRASFDARYGFLHTIPDVKERRRVAATIRRIASLDDSLLTSNPREAVIALFYMSVAALQDLGLLLLRGETPEELAGRTRERSAPAASSLDFLVTAFYHARYSNREVPPRQAIACRDAYRSLLTAVRLEAGNERAVHARTAAVG